MPSSTIVPPYMMSMLSHPQRAIAAPPSTRSRHDNTSDTLERPAAPEQRSWQMLRFAAASMELRRPQFRAHLSGREVHSV